jgi:5-methylcytosine-specific restriction protein A
MFELRKVYRRKDLHEEFGGQEQGGIVTPRSHPLIFLITGEGGTDYGYLDEEYNDGTFLYYGEGREGSMTFVRGNRAVRDHALNGRDLHLFEKVPPAHLRYRGQFLCAGYETVPDVPDANGSLRSAIAFQLVPAVGDNTDEQTAASEVVGLSLEALREAALRTPSDSNTSTEAKRKAYKRSAAVRAYVFARANGVCEGCSAMAPFLTPAGLPYLEPHHTRRISDGGPDHPAAVIALCPTCHRRAHYADDGNEYNESLIQTLLELEGALAPPRAPLDTLSSKHSGPYRLSRRSL